VIAVPASSPTQVLSFPPLTIEFPALTPATKLMNDDSFTDAIPSNQADFVALVTARSDYTTRKQRDDANKIG